MGISIPEPPPAPLQCLPLRPVFLPLCDDDILALAKQVIRNKSATIGRILHLDANVLLSGHLLRGVVIQIENEINWPGAILSNENLIFKLFFRK